MIGTIYAIIMGATTLTVPQAPLSLKHLIVYVLQLVVLLFWEWRLQKENWEIRSRKILLNKV